MKQPSLEKVMGSHWADYTEFSFQWDGVRFELKRRINEQGHGFDPMFFHVWDVTGSYKDEKAGRNNCLRFEVRDSVERIRKRLRWSD